MVIEIVRGCLLDALDKQEVVCIGHVVNTLGVMGAGLAKNIRNRYPKVYAEYKEGVDDWTRSYGVRSGLLGQYQELFISDTPTDSRAVFNLFAQDDVGTHKRQLNYGALAQALVSMARETRWTIHSGYSVGFPHLMGCGLAGGEWNIVLEMIEFIFRDHNVKIYQL